MYRNKYWLAYTLISTLLIGCSTAKKAVVEHKGSKVYSKQHPEGIDINAESRTTRVLKDEKDSSVIQRDGYFITREKRIIATTTEEDPYLSKIQNNQEFEGKVEPLPLLAKPVKQTAVQIESNTVNTSVMAEPKVNNHLGKSDQHTEIVTEAKDLDDLTASGFLLANPAGMQNMSWPIAGAPEVRSRFGKVGGKFNDGIVINSPLGTKVLAAGDGKVLHCGKEFEGYGNIVIIKHDQDIMTAYAHLQDVMVKQGDKIKKGQVIATVGKSGNVKDAQLHFSMRKGKKTINPEAKL